MLKEIQQVLRLLMVMKQPRKHKIGGILVLLWTEENALDRLNCTVAAAGPWCERMKMEALQSVRSDLKDGLDTGPHPEPDPEELRAFTDLYGSLRLLLSCQMNSARVFIPEEHARLEMFLHTFSLANAGIEIRLKFKFNQRIFQQEFRVKIKHNFTLAGKQSVSLDVTCNTHPPGCLVKGNWCRRGHPVRGNTLSLSIPPQVMNQGLYGVLSLQPVTLLRPCALQYPNLAIQLTQIQVLIYSPSKVPVTGPSAFFQSLPSHLDCHELGLHGLHCSSFQDPVHSSGTVYTVDQGNGEEPCQKASVQPLHQSLLISLFLQHSDPFTMQLSDVVVTEMLIEHHLEDILNNNRQAVVNALQSELKKALKTQTRRNKDQEKMSSAAKVILSSSISIVSCSSNMGFRSACMSSMKVQSTHELSASLRESLRRVTSWKFIPKGTCYSAEIEEHPETMEPTRTEI